jgi:hypothetical protein
MFLAHLPMKSFTQDILGGGKVTGNMQLDAQIYSEDSKLGITDSSLNYKKFGMNGFANILYTNGDFKAGIRFEGYLNPLSGYDPRYEGVGIPYWFVGYKLGALEMTAGHFYEQFGSGLVLRSWEEWTLGYDNNIYGFNAKFTPVNGVTLKGLVGVQRYFWEPYEINNRGIVRGVDGDFYLNDIFGGMTDAKTKITLGGSFVSKYEKPPLLTFSKDSAYTIIDEFGDTTNWTEKITYKYNLPYNVGSWAARMNLASGGFNFYAEYAQKGNDPNFTYNEDKTLIYKNGHALYSTVSYSRKGLGVFLAMKWIDYMHFKSKMTEYQPPPMLDINYLPAISKEHPYSLATMYPYATKQNGEAGFKAEVIYTIPKKTKIGGEYGTTIEVDYAYTNSIKKEPISPAIPIDSTGTDGYQTKFLSFGDIPFYRDLDIMIDRKFNKKLKVKLAYFNQTYNLNVIEKDEFDEEEMVYANIGVMDLTYKFTNTHSLRIEAQGLWTKEDKGDWAAMTLEYNISPAWFFAVMDEWNYGNPDDNMQIHYYNASFGYTNKTNRISLRYGRQREGLLCVGGVCRYVPASTGLTITITSSF